MTAQATTRIDRTSVPEQVFRATCTAILEGRYAPGEKLPTQRALAREFGVNMTTVREAVKKLEQLRLIEVRHGDAMRVRDWRRHGSLDVVAHMIFGAHMIDVEVLRNVLEARRLLLTECARLAADRATDEQIARLAQLGGDLAEIEDPRAAQLVDFEFYEELGAASGNLVCALIINSIRDLYLENAEAFSAIVADRTETAPLYAAVAAAVADGAAEAAADAARELTGLQERRLLELAEAVFGA